MIARHETSADRLDIWARIAAPVPKDAISWRQDGKPVTRDGKTAARFVAFIDAQFVRARLDEVVPGEWDVTLEPLPPMAASPDGEVLQEPFAFKARLQVLGVIREDVGQGKDYKTAATDALKRAAMRFGIGHELYDYEQNWVQLDGDGKFAKPIEDPQKAYERRHGGNGSVVKSATARETIQGDTRPAAEREATPHVPASQQGATESPAPSDDPACPVCGGRMWDNRENKRNPRAPDFKCRDRSCEGVIWPPKPAA